MKFSLRFRSCALLMTSLLSLTGCVTDKVLPHNTPAPVPAAEAGTQSPARVSMLLPLSGKDAKLGEAMQNAATLALADLGYSNFELDFQDTGSSPAGAKTAAKKAIDSGSKMLIGPIFAEEVKAARTEAAAAHLNLISFSTDTSATGSGSYIMGILPQDQARQMAFFAAAHKLHRVLVIAQPGAYGQLTTNGFIQAARARGIDAIGPIWIDENINATLETYLSALPVQTANSSPAFEAIFMPVPAAQASKILPMITEKMGAQKPVLLGTGLWDDADIMTYPALVGAYYGAPPPQSRERFEHLYTRQYGAPPPRLASLGYDAAALSIVIGRTQGGAGYTQKTITSSAGYSGIDGIFRFKESGVIERGLAVLQIQPGGRIISSPAPTSFNGSSSVTP